MRPEKIVIFQGSRPDTAPDALIITFAELVRWIRRGILIKHLFRYREARLICFRLEVLPGPFFSCVALRLLSRSKASLEDELGRREEVTIAVIARFFCDFVSDLMKKGGFIQQISREVARIGTTSREAHLKELNLKLSPVYLRTDLSFGIRSGGSVGHIAGVLNNLGNFTGAPLFLTTDKVPTVRRDIATHIILPEGSFMNFRELSLFAFNDTFGRKAAAILDRQDISLIYQRYSIDNFTGLVLASRYRVPFVLEYNGSEIWVASHWGTPLRHESLAERIEILNLEAANVIVVVSAALKAELIGRGIRHDKILVNPNGVDSELYNPDIDGSQIRKGYSLEGKIVIGFIGTFGKWHGAEILADAFGRLLRQYPEYRRSVRLLMIGDGVTMPQVRQALQRYAVGEACILCGRVPQEEGPAHLAACDILASPHVPNPDGTPFFGSPTKLFEYMAIGKGIVASDLDQIGEVLKHNETAWMVKPGDADSLMLGLKVLVDDEALRERLGKSARREAVSKYTWREHTRRIIEKLGKSGHERTGGNHAAGETACMTKK